jgi:predicted unusual protein kinase regulating ubiquinone biosynthesis (AarF/ABC1/UbiB family)
VRKGLAAGTAGAAAAAGVVLLLRGRARAREGGRRAGEGGRRAGDSRRRGNLRLSRGLAALRLAARGGARYAGSAPRLFAAAGEHRQQLRNDLALQTAEDVASTLGTMKGVLMKLGQMASYIDNGLSPSVRRTLSRLQDSVPPMSADLAASVIEEELGRRPDQLFARWDPEPIAAASIGQVHRAITRDGRAVAVKVQYPGIAETIAADLGNVALLRRMLRVTAPSQDVDALLAELRERAGEELDYRKEAGNQRLFAGYYEGHPTIVIPAVVGELSTRRVVTSELSDGARFAEMAGWPQAERDLAAETIYRFVFRSLYELHAFNGDPHPGNYLFHGGGRVTFLDFGLVRRFTPVELRPLAQMARYLCVEHDPEGFRRNLEKAGFLRADAPLSTQQIVDHMAVFYDTVRESRPLTMTVDYSSAVVRRFFDVRSPVTAYAQIPRSYVLLQRINLGLFGLLGELTATANWRAIAEEIWPFVLGPPTTPMGEAEAAWRAGRPAPGAAPAGH